MMDDKMRQDDERHKTPGKTTKYGRKYAK